MFGVEPRASVMEINPGSPLFPHTILHRLESLLPTLSLFGASISAPQMGPPDSVDIEEVGMLWCLGVWGKACVSSGQTLPSIPGGLPTSQKSSLSLGGPGEGTVLTWYTPE